MFQQNALSARSSRPGSRRQFLGQLTVCAAALSARAAAAETPPPGRLAGNHYPWLVYFRRDGREFGKHLDADLQEVADSGLNDFEPMATAPDQITRFGESLKAHGLGMYSLYVNSTLHEADTAERSIQEVLAIARAARPFGTRIIVTNPSPLRWGGPEDKTDAQLETQGRALERLGRQLHDLGCTLAYHNHDIELRQAAREFRHMLTGTDPRWVSFCLDAHWIYRGSGNSQVALFDVVELYADRIVELHLRQSKNGIWTEVFSAEGDVDYRRLVAALVRHRVRPWLVLEQAIEKGSPKTLNALEAQRRSVQVARKVFAPLLS